MNLKTNCCRCSNILNAKFKYKKLDGVICKLCYEKEYRKLNKEKLNKWHKTYADANRDVINAQAKARYNDPNHNRKIKDKEWRKNNPEYIRFKANEEYKVKYKKDKIYTIRRVIRRRFNMAIKNRSHISSIWNHVGCPMIDFINYIEKQWKPGMSWDNYGDWHLDHIEPLFKFDLSNIEQLNIAMNFKNFQPLWKEEHIEKCRKDGSYES